VAGLDHAAHVPFGCTGLGEDLRERILRADGDDDDFAASEIVRGFVGRLGRLVNSRRVEVVG
jgi:hypothetical protein